MQAPGSPNGSVMTQAELEAYRKRKDQEKADRHASESEDEEDNINYDSEDDGKKSKQNDQRRRQEAHFAGYRQQMMKTTVGPPSIEHNRIPSIQGPWMNIPDSDSDDDVPLGMLQARNQKSRMSRFTRSNPNLRASAQQQIVRPGSAQGRPNNGSHLQLPSFATNLPQDPFQDPYQDPFTINKKPMFTGGLISVIANEERAKASRRGGSTVSLQAPPSQGFSGFGLSMPSQQMGAQYGMMGQQGSRPGTPSQMQQHIPQGIQDQMQFMQTMTYGAQHRPAHSWNGTPMRPGTSGSMAAPLPKPAMPAAYGGYAQSIPPAERSNVGLPSRYRPVTKAKA
ncbi:hypothetical protein HG530_015255 [Fusarium avenaceum]|nr:hypothetical protein HG530_015255 [Fusarium avenaceum]